MKDPGKSIFSLLLKQKVQVVRYKADLHLFKSNIQYCNDSYSQT
jgi:hypothetical protein